MNTFIFNWWEKLFQILDLLTPLGLFKKIAKKEKLSYGLVEIWIIGTFILSFFAAFFSSLNWFRPTWNFLIIFGSWRLLEIFVVNFNVLFFDLFRANREGRAYQLGGYRRLLVLVFMNYFEVIFWFTIIFKKNIAHFRSCNSLLNESLSPIYLSVVTMTTLGSGDIFPVDNIGMLITLLQNLFGIFLAVAIIGKFISFLPTPKSVKEN